MKRPNEFEVFNKKNGNKWRVYACYICFYEVKILLCTEAYY